MFLQPFTVVSIFNYLIVNKRKKPADVHSGRKLDNRFPEYKKLQ